MTKEEFKELQLQQQQSGKPLTSYLQEVGVGYSTWHYWRKKFEREDKPCEMAPISFSSPEPPTSTSLFDSVVPSGATLLFPNGLRAHFGSGTEQVLTDLLNKSLAGNVLP